MAGYYSVKMRADGNVRVTSCNPVAQEAIWGWGEGGGSGAQFYGRATGRRGARGNEWEWTLTPGAVGRMIGYIDAHVNDRNYYDARSAKAAQELRRKLIDVRSR